MTAIAFDPAVFRLQFKAFGNVNCFPDATLSGWWDIATGFISDWPSCPFTGKQQTQALNLMTAHIGAIFTAIASGEPTVQMTQATIDKVNVTVEPPPVQQMSQFQYWLGLTPYGLMLLALLNTVTAGGFYIGGLPERDAFRRVGGGFGGVLPRRGW
jgi:hypothetical protein